MGLSVGERGRTDTSDEVYVGVERGSVAGKGGVVAFVPFRIVTSKRR